MTHVTAGVGGAVVDVGVALADESEALAAWIDAEVAHRIHDVLGRCRRAIEEVLGVNCRQADSVLVPAPEIRTSHERLACWSVAVFESIIVRQTILDISVMAHWYD